MHRKAALLLTVTVLLAVTLTACSRPRERFAAPSAEPSRPSPAGLPDPIPTASQAPSATLLPSATPYATATALVLNQALPAEMQGDLDELDALLEDLLREVSSGGSGITVP